MSRMSSRARLGITLLALLVAGVTAAGARASARPKAAPQAGAPSCADGTTRQTTSGPVCGIVVSDDDEYLGIPYAAPPVGTLRWAAPQPPAPWTSLRPATQFGSSCVQSPEVAPGGPRQLSPGVRTACSSTSRDRPMTAAASPCSSTSMAAVS